MTPEEREALRLAEEAEAQRLAQEAAATNSTMQPTDLIGQQGQQKTGMDTNPMLMGGLGGAAAFQGMFPFASEAAANSRGTTLPSLIGSGNSQFTGTNTGRLTQGTQIVPQTQLSTINQPPAVQSSGSLLNKTTTARPGTANYGVNRTSPYTMGPFKSLLGTLTKGLVGSFAVAPNTADAPTVSGAFNRRVAAGEDPAEVRASLGLDADYGNAQDFGYAVPDTSNRKVDFMSDGTGVLNGVSLFTGGAKTTGNNYADVVNADNARKAQEAEYAAAAEAEAVADANAFVPPLDFAGEIQNNPEQYSGLIENNPFTSLGGTPVEDNEFTVAPAVQESPAPTAAQEFRPVGGGFSFGGDTPIPADREGGFIPEREGFFTGGTPIFANQGQAPAPVAGVPAAVEATTPESVANLSVNGTDVAAPGSPQAIFEAIRAKGPLSPELIAAGKSRAEKIGTTFDPETGFSREPFLQYQQSQNRPGYGYAGAANDQYRSADFDTISQGVFDTPMTGMRPINAETGEPLSQGVIDAAARAGLELPMGSVPLPQAPVNSVPMGRDATRARLGGMTLNQYLNAPDGAVSGLRTDPQGRMIPGRGREAQDGVFAYDDMTRADAYGQYEDEVSQAYQRQSERMQQRADQRDGTAGPRTYGGYTTSQLRGMVGGGDNLRAAQMRAEAGLNPVTGNRESTEEQNQLQTEVLKARLAQLKEQDPDKLSKAESYADRLNLQGDARTAFIFSQMGTAMDDVFGLEGTGAGGGGGGQSHVALNAAAKNSGQSTYVGPDGQTYDVQ